MEMAEGFQKYRGSLEEIFQRYGHEDYRWIDPKKIIVSQWVRMKCMFGCREFGNNACCPPNVPSVAECENFFHEYETAAIFRFSKRVDRPENRHAWSKKTNLELSKMEREIFLAGFERVFLLFMDSCSICATCTADRTKCKEPAIARPSPESMAVDVFSTVRQYGFSIATLKDHTDEMNRFAFLMVE